jgi:hypothetical protein
LEEEVSEVGSISTDGTVMGVEIEAIRHNAAAFDMHDIMKDLLVSVVIQRKDGRCVCVELGGVGGARFKSVMTKLLDDSGAASSLELRREHQLQGSSSIFCPWPNPLNRLPITSVLTAYRQLLLPMAFTEEKEGVNTRLQDRSHVAVIDHST